MKTLAITSKTSMNVPARFTMAELEAANPGVKYPTLNARVDKLVKSGDLLEVATVKTGTGRGRAALVYALKDASLNPKDKSDPLYQAKKQGRFVPVVTVATTVPATAETVTVPVEVVADTTPAAVTETAV